MTVLYIILGIIVGVPAYLLLNTLLALLARPFAAMFVYLWPDTADSSFMNEIKGGEGSLADSLGKVAKVLGCFILVAILCVLIIALICRLLWLVYQIFRAWFKLIKFCWQLGNKTKNKTETKTK